MDTFSSFLKWHWDQYPPLHQNRVNLLIHIVAVPVFVISTIGLVGRILDFEIFSALGYGVLAAISMWAQKVGHQMERNQPDPFDGPLDAAKRVFTEQFITFWRFVWSGGWWSHLNRGQSEAADP